MLALKEGIARFKKSFNDDDNNDDDNNDEDDDDCHGGVDNDDKIQV